MLAKAKPKLFSLQRLEAHADFGERRYDEALKKLDRLERDFGARLAGLTMLGEVYLKLREWAKAAFVEAGEIDNELPAVYLGQARAALGERHYEEAADLALASIGLLFHQPRAHYLLGLAHFRGGDAARAEQALLVAPQMAPQMAVDLWRLFTGQTSGKNLGLVYLPEAS